MQIDQSSQILQSMINFIKSHGDERVNEIEDEAREMFNIEKEKLIESEKSRLEEKHTKDLQNEEVKMKIARSAEVNKARIEKMRRTANLVDSLLFDAKVKMQQKMQDEPDSYAALLEQMLVQGLIKMIEPKVILKVRQSDLDAVKGIIDGAIEKYKAAMLDQVKALTGRDDIPCEVLVDEKNFLPEWNAEDQKNSCLGGF